MYGDAYVFYGNALGGNDHLEGGDDGDTLFGDGESLDSNGPGNITRGGDDLLEGGAGPDILFGDAREMLNACGGNDYLDGGTGDDFFFGDAYLMSGNSRGGNDTFGFSHGPAGSPDQTFGHDIVGDFHQGEDRLAFDRSEAKSIADLQIVQDGDDTVITVPDHGTVELQGVTAPLTASDFIFVA
jgi:Ca2+-binding RTX toxin-like protein